jgi:hypothetical protein
MPPIPQSPVCGIAVGLSLGRGSSRGISLVRLFVVQGGVGCRVGALADHRLLIGLGGLALALRCRRKVFGCSSD